MGIMSRRRVAAKKAQKVVEAPRAPEPQKPKEEPKPLKPRRKEMVPASMLDRED